MATEITYHNPDDGITLIVPVGTQRSARVLLPREVAMWLLVQLQIALGSPQEGN
jgi:hypothetical protein